MKFGKHLFVFGLALGLMAGVYAMKSNQDVDTTMPVKPRPDLGMGSQVGVPREPRENPPSIEEMRKRMEEAKKIVVQGREILTAIKTRDLAKVKEIIETGKFPVNSEIRVLDEDRSSTALVESAKANQFDIVKYLVGKGANVNTKDKIRHRGVPGRVEAAVVRYVDHYSALDYAKQNNNAEMIKFLQDHAVLDNWPILTAIKTGDVAKVKELIETGKSPVRIGISMRDGTEATPLVEAAKVNKLDIVKYLVEKGADVNAKDRTTDFGPGGIQIGGERLFERSALDYAKRNNNAEMIKFLQDHGAK